MLAVWIALIVVSTATVGADVVDDCSVQLTLACWLLVDDATGSTSGIVAACVPEPRSTALGCDCEGSSVAKARATRAKPSAWRRWRSRDWEF